MFAAKSTNGFLGRLLKQLRRERKVAALHRSHDHGVEPLEPYRLVIRRDGIEILLRFLAGLEEQRFQFLVQSPAGARRRVIEMHPLPAHLEPELFFDGLHHLRGHVEAGKPLDDKCLYRPGEFFGRRHERKRWSN